MDARLFKLLVASAAAVVLTGCMSTVTMEIEYDKNLYDGYGGKMVVEPVTDPAQDDLKCESFDAAANKVQSLRWTPELFKNLDARAWEEDSIVIIMTFQVPSGTKALYLTLLANKRRDNYFKQKKILLSSGRNLKVEIETDGSITYSIKKKV